MTPMDEREYRLSLRIDRRVVRTWIEAGWLGDNRGDGLSDGEVARLALIGDLKDRFGVNDEGIDVILALVDQVYGLRRSLRTVLASAARSRSIATKRPAGARRLKPKTRRSLPRRPASPRSS
ncbi:MAG TPA: transcriptional regulator [Aestuariivirgaceae bacterium]|nr:transcriptional regulator [Aestuariivirgaceae bacterium]